MEARTELLGNLVTGPVCDFHASGFFFACMREKILKNGVRLIDSRNLGCGIRIENQGTKFMSLGYSFEKEFYINITGVWITMDELGDFQNELNEMRSLLIEAKSSFDL